MELKVMGLAIAMSVALAVVMRVMGAIMSDEEKLDALLLSKYPKRVCVLALLWALSLGIAFIAFVVWMIRL